MAISYVGGQTAGRTNASSALSVNFALTGGSASVPAAGDLVIVTVVTGSAGGTPAMAITTPSGYTALGQLNVSATAEDTSMNVSYKFMGSTPDTAVTIPGTTNNAWGQSYTIKVYRGVDPSTPMDVTPTTATGSGVDNLPDGAPITPVTAGAWIVVAGGGAAAAGGAYTAAALTAFQTTNGQDTNDGNSGVGHTTWTSGEYNPAKFAGGSVNAANSWACYTIALRPAPDQVQAPRSMHQHRMRRAA